MHGQQNVKKKYSVMFCKGLYFINHLIGKVEMNIISMIGVRPWKTLRSYEVEK